jgi:hypothetical protein
MYVCEVFDDLVISANYEHFQIDMPMGTLVQYI